MTSSEQNWVLGVILGLLGSIAINTGNNVQSMGLQKLQDLKVPKKAQRRKKRRTFLSLVKESPKTAPLEDDNGCEENEETDVAKAKPYDSTTWIVGTIIFVSGSLLNFASYAFAAQSMLASLESIQFVTNLIFGKFMLGATVTRRMLIGTCLTVAGTILAVQFSSKETLDLRVEEMKRLYLNPVYIAYLILMGGLLLVLNFIYGFFDHIEEEQNPILFKYRSIVLSLSYSIWSALFGTQSVVQAKIIAELLAVQSKGEENIFASWFTYLTIFLWIATVGVWLMRLNNALSKFDPLFIIPLLQCSFIFFAIVSGGIYFQEFNTFSPIQWVGFWIGIGIMFSGLVLLTPKGSKEDHVLPREVVEALVLLGGVAEDGRGSLARPPQTPVSSPRQDGDDTDSDRPQLTKHAEPHMSRVTFTVPVHSNGKIENEPKIAQESYGTPPKQTLPSQPGQDGIGGVKEVVKDVIMESARKMVLSSHTNLLTNAMSSATMDSEAEAKRRRLIQRAQSLVEKTSKEEGPFTREIKHRIDELKHELETDIAENVEFYNKCPPFTPPVNAMHFSSPKRERRNSIEQKRHIHFSPYSCGNYIDEMRSEAADSDAESTESSRPTLI